MLFLLSIVAIAITKRDISLKISRGSQRISASKNDPKVFWYTYIVLYVQSSLFIKTTKRSNKVAFMER